MEQHKAPPEHQLPTEYIIAILADVVAGHHTSLATKFREHPEIICKYEYFLPPKSRRRISLASVKRYLRCCPGDFVPYAFNVFSYYLVNFKLNDKSCRANASTNLLELITLLNYSFDMPDLCLQILNMPFTCLCAAVSVEGPGSDLVAQERRSLRPSFSTLTGGPWFPPKGLISAKRVMNNARRFFVKQGPTFKERTLVNQCQKLAQVATDCLHDRRPEPK